MEVNLSGDPADRTVQVRLSVRAPVGAVAAQGDAASIRPRACWPERDRGDRRSRRRDGGTRSEARSRPHPGAGIKKFLEGDGDLLTSLGAITKSFKAILGRARKGEGLLGSLTCCQDQESATGRHQLSNDALHYLNSILKKIEKGQALARQAPDGFQEGSLAPASRWPARSTPCSRC